MAGPRENPALRETRRTRNVQEFRHDTYKARGKPKEPTVCPQCGAVFHKGRWTWAPAPSDAHKATCPACHRIHDDYPAGILVLKGSYLAPHKDELLGLVHNEEEQEKQEHPLSRIMSVREGRKEIEIRTTDTHLARRIGEALRHAYRGRLTRRYGKEQEFIRVTWTRNGG